MDWLVPGPAPRAILCWAMLLGTGVALADDRVTVEPRDKWSAVFADTEVTFRYAVASDRPFEGHLGWRFSVGRGTIARGELPVKVRPGEPALVDVTLRVPKAAEGVIVEGQLEAGFYATGAGQPEGTSVRPVRVFPRDPFLNRRQWLEKLEITLFDPEKKTAKQFDEANIPYKFTKNPASLDNLAQGLLVIGEGTSLRDYRGVVGTMARVAVAGIPVLCLAPADGTLPMPGTKDSPLPAPERMTFRQCDVITELDKRLDAFAWPQCSPVATRFATTADRDRVLLDVADDKQAWPWIEVRYAAPGNTLLLCGFGIIRRYDAGPTPRFLLARLFERLTDQATLP